MEQDTTIQTPFFSPSRWNENSRIAIGQYIIACSQWEYVLELLFKDSCINSSDPFKDKMKVADGVNKSKSKEKTKLLETLKYHNDPRCKKILEYIDELDKRYIRGRHLLIHGFHHIHENKEMINRLNKDAEDIGEILSAEEYIKASEEINLIVNKINIIRKDVFGNTAKSKTSLSDAGSCTTSASYIINFELPDFSSSTALAKKPDPATSAG